MNGETKLVKSIPEKDIKKILEILKNSIDPLNKQISLELGLYTLIYQMIFFNPALSHVVASAIFNAQDSVVPYLNHIDFFEGETPPNNIDGIATYFTKVAMMMRDENLVPKGSSIH